MTRMISITKLGPEADAMIKHLAPGDELIIEEGGKVVAHITPVASRLKVPAFRVPGLWAGKIRMADDFDDPLPESYWLGEE